MLCQNSTLTWEEVEKKHEKWIEDRDSFCINMVDPLNENEYLMEDIRILIALMKAISADFDLYWESNEQ